MRRKRQSVTLNQQVGAKPSPRRRRWAKRALATLFVLFVIGGFFFGGIFVTRFRQVMLTVTEKLDLPVNLVSDPQNAPDWKGKERVNILLLGVDQRPDEAGLPTRTDTMLVLTIDPYGKTAGLLSLPRDLWVPIPLANGSVINERINAAHVLGETTNYPGGGPALAKKTVEWLLGVKIHYYARVDFDGFQKIIDTMGGITLDVDKPLRDDEYPTPNYSTIRIYIPAGLQHMNGEVALQYARSRHQDSDLGRNQRQQQVLMAIRQRAVELNLVPKLPELFLELKDAVKTDMSLSDIRALARLGRDIDTSNLTTAAIDYSAVTPTVTADGAQILVPKRDAIRDLVLQVFFDPRLREEGAKVEVLNGTTITGLAARTATVLKNRGIKDITIDNTSDRHDYQDTTIVNCGGKPYTSGLIASALGIPSERVQSGGDPGCTVDVQVILGANANIPRE